MNRSVAYGAPKQLGGSVYPYAVMMDQVYWAEATDSLLNSHRFNWVNILYSDGHVGTKRNSEQVDVRWQDDVCYAVDSLFAYAVVPSVEAIWPHAEDCDWNPYISNFDVYRGDLGRRPGYIPETWEPPSGWSSGTIPGYFREDWILPAGVIDQAYLP